MRRSFVLAVATIVGAVILTDWCFKSPRPLVVQNQDTVQPVNAGDTVKPVKRQEPGASTSRVKEIHFTIKPQM